MGYQPMLSKNDHGLVPVPRSRHMHDVGVIAIGRNEGERLRRCLESVAGRGMSVVYVDSGSGDGSVALARSLGAEVVELDMSRPFSAARARNAGVERLVLINPSVAFVQFVDGDCEVREGWVERARRELESRPDVAVVCGRRRERFPDASIYNRLADLEWDTPIGEVKSCGGDAMMRLAALQQVGGFDPSVVAGEEPELCQRLRRAGWKVLRVDAEMTWHDAAMTRFAQWWNRQVRSGYGATDVATRFRDEHDPLFVRQVQSAAVWTAGWSALLLGGITIALILGGRWRFPIACVAAAVVLALWVVQALRLALRDSRRTGSLKTAIAYGFLTMIAKWGFWFGRRRYFRDRRAGRLTRLIDYKASGAPATA